MIPLSLYIHIPWCIRKCHYCDFNSHKLEKSLPDRAYLNALIADLKNDLARFAGRNICSIFIGGGTPSLLSADVYFELLTTISHLCKLEKNIEITLEANPGTIEHGLFSDYVAAGINRLSIGIQTFNNNFLKKLGRIHDEDQACLAIDLARKAGFKNINLDIMHSLPDQSLDDSLADLKKAITFNPEHLSWYQLTIEPNTLFYKTRPTLPSIDDIWKMEQRGLDLLANNGFMRYEISAFCRDNKFSDHNLNYWLFGDYYGIGAGAHGKYTNVELKKVYRTNKYRQPKDYLSSEKDYLSGIQEVCAKDLLFEFMLNATRLERKIENSLFTSRTMLPYNSIVNLLEKSANMGLINLTSTYWQVTPLGRQYTNNLQEIFLP